MKLTAKQRAILAGKLGKGAARAMEILAALGRIQDAPDMVEAGSVQVSGISYNNIGEHGLAFLEDWADMGSQAVVPATMNPGGSDRRIWKSLGFSPAFVRKQERVIKALEGLGIKPTLTCTPYHVGVTPRCGEHVAWAESSAVCFANSVLGARTNREGGPSAIAAALTGLTPRHTLHTDKGRLPTRIVEVKCAVPTAADAGALGYLIGRLVSSDKAGGVPFITGTQPPAGAERLTWLKALGAGMAASGSVGLYHLDSVTPEAVALGSRMAKGVKQKNLIKDLASAHEALNKGKGKLDVVAVGCPHASPEELTRILKLLSWRKAKVPFWIFMAEDVRKHAEETGVAAALGRCGATLVADTCMVVAPLKDLGIHTLATDSAKAAFYLPSHHGASVYFGSLEQNVEAALSGNWGSR
jgi:predicted aconitase